MKTQPAIRYFESVTAQAQHTPLIPAIRAVVTQRMSDKTTAASVMGLTCQMHPSDGVAVRAAVDAFLTIFPQTYFVDRAWPREADTIPQSPHGKRLICGIELLLLCLQSIPDKHKTSAQLCICSAEASAKSGSIGGIIHMQLQNMHLIDKRAMSACFNVVLVLGMLENVVGLELTLSDENIRAHSGETSHISSRDKL